MRIAVPLWTQRVIVAIKGGGDFICAILLLYAVLRFVLTLEAIALVKQLIMYFFGVT